LHVDRDRGDVLRPSRGARLSEARQDHEVRGRLSWRPRLRADERGAEVAEGLSRGHAGLGRHPARPRGRGADRPLQRPRHRRGAPRGVRRRARRGHRRAVPAAHPAPAGLPRGAAHAHATPRDPADLRRGRHGFRFAYGGAQEYYGVVPDLAAYGKIIGGGFPLACIAGPKAIMRHFDAALEGTPDYVWQAGTFNGNAIACAAGLATLAELRKPGMYQRLFKTGARLKAGLQAAVTKHGVAAQVSGEPPV